MKSAAMNRQNTVLGVFQQAFKESDIVSSDNIKAFLKKSFGLDENESNKFLSNFKFNTFLSNNVSASNSVSYQTSEIFSFLKGKLLNNNFQDAKISSFQDSGLVFAGSINSNLDRISEWIFKVAKLIQKNGINLFAVLSAEDHDEDGLITTDDLRIAFTKMKLNLNTNDIETMLEYFNYSNNDKVKIEDFSKNFMAHLNENFNF